MKANKRGPGRPRKNKPELINVTITRKAYTIVTKEVAKQKRAGVKTNFYETLDLMVGA